MTLRRFVGSFAVLTPMLIAGCDADNSTAAISTAPTTAVAEGPLALETISAVPQGAGVQFNTEFQFTAVGNFPAGTQFAWNFGDGSSATTSSPTVSRVFAQAGAFGVSVEARRQGASTSSVATPVTVRSLIGRWFGTITGFTRFPLQRPVPITSFELLVANQTLDGSSVMLHGRWADDAGCRENRPEFLRQMLRPEAAATVTFGVNALSCAESDFYLTGRADAAFNRVEGLCNVAGGNPDCRFSMVRE